MADSSSSSDDEEEKAKLESAAWPSFSRDHVLKTGSKSDTEFQPKKSLRNSSDLEEQRDYRNVDSTPELRAFIAKKLTSWLDSSISVVDGQTSRNLPSLAAQDDQDDDFQLFSTSKPGLPAEETQPVRRKQRPLHSSSDSDSEEERAKLSSVAVSYDQILQSNWPPMPQAQQVASNLSPTNTHSALTSSESSHSRHYDRARDLKSKKHKMRQSGGDDDEAGGECFNRNGSTKRKRKKKKTEVIPDCDAKETVTETDLPPIAKTSKCGKLGLHAPPVDSENGSTHPPEQSKQTFKKKKKKQRAKEKDAASEMNQANSSGKSVR